MKILHYFPTTRLSEGGTVRAALDICSVLSTRGHEVVWLTCDDTDVPASWKNDEQNSPKVVHLGGFEKSGDRLTKAQCAIACTAIQKVDVVHVHAMWNPSNPQISRVCHDAKKPWVLSVHGMLDDWSMSQRTLKKRMYLSTVGRCMVRNPAVFHTTAEAENRQASKWFKHKNTAVVPCIVDLEPYAIVPSPEVAQQTFGQTAEPTVLFLSRVHEKKSIETLIDAAKILQSNGTPIRVLIAGTGEDSYIETLKARAKSKGVDDCVFFLGMVVGELKLSLFSLADIFALPTQQENFGLVYPEAMLCETAVIGTKGTDIWQELEEGGAVIAERTPEAFAREIKKLMLDKETLRKKGAQGREYILQWLNTDTVAQNYEAMYEQAISVQKP